MDGHIILHVNHLGTIVLAGRAVFATIASHHARRALNTVNRGNPKPIESIDYPKTLKRDDKFKYTKSEKRLLVAATPRNRRRRRDRGALVLASLTICREKRERKEERERERDDRDGWG